MVMMVVWICLPGIFLYWLEMDTRQEEKLLAISTAKAFFQQVVISRDWNASHEGVYVPTTSKTPPNKYLPLPNRDLIATNGLKLTQINPSYMTRQLTELAKENSGGIQFHITSLTPIRPENKAMDWEYQWLNSFQQGSKEQGEFFKDGNITWFRYMAPLLATQKCLKCHDHQGYKQGDIIGGLSVSVPYPTHTHFNLIIGYGVVVIIGLFFIFIGNTFWERKRRLFDATFNSPVPTCVTDHNYTILMANESYWTEFGALPPHQKTIQCYEHRPGESCHTENCPLTQIMNGSSNYTYEASKEKDGVCQHFIVSSKPLFDGKGKAIGIVESFQEITVRKQAEEALAASNRKLESLSNTDGLTAIANRRYFDKVLTQEYARHARSKAELSLILLDLDYFKSFNDNYGHVTGDQCLQQIAQVIADCATRPADLAARYGGEEFACILPETSSKGALAIAEKIRLNIMALAIPHQKSEVANCVTASLGVVTVQCQEDGSVMDIVTRVDELLYRAKASGRNHVESSAFPAAEGELKRELIRLAWKESFCCGNKMIDSQHRSLVQISNNLLEAFLSERPATDIAEIINILFADISQHFHDEELLLKEVNYPEITEHAQAHAKLLAKSHELAAQFKVSSLTAGDVFQFLAYEVVMQHMLTADQKFFPFISDDEYS